MEDELEIEKEFAPETIKDMNEQFFRIDERLNSVDSLEKLEHFLRTLPQNPADLKWAVLAADQALYGLLICNLTGGNYNRVLEKTSEKKGGPKLINFDTALKRAQDPSRMRQTCFSKPLCLDRSQRREILEFHKHLRDNMEHYRPRSWSIEYAYVFKKLEIVVVACEQLAFATGNFIFSGFPELKGKTERAINNIKTLLKGYRDAGFRVVAKPHNDHNGDQ